MTNNFIEFALGLKLHFEMPADIHTCQAFKYHWMVWKFCGMQPPKNSAWRIAYIIYALVLNLSVTVLFPATLIINCCLSDNMNEFCENLYITITDVVCNLKFLNVYIVRNQLLKVRPILEKLDVRAKTTNEIKALQEGMDSANYCFITFFKMFCCAIVTSQLVVYMSQERMLMYPAWFPFDWKSSRRNFLLAHCYQLYGLTVQAIQDLGNDTYPQAYLSILAAHIKALSLRFRYLGTQTNAMTSRYAYECKERNYRELVECIKDHKIIIDLFLTIQGTISNTCLAQFICTGLAQCTIGVYMLYVGMDYSKLLNISIFFSAVTLEIFILCYYGDRLCQESENLTDAIYSCNWIDQHKDFKKAIQLLLQRSQKIMVIKAGNLIPVRLPTFVNVVKTAYSVFTVLNEVK